MKPEEQKRREMQTLTVSKLSSPLVFGKVRRSRLFSLLDKARKSPLIWMTGPPGAGKTTLAASYFQASGISSLWYHVDVGDADLASFFYFLGAGVQSPHKPLPLFTAEYRAGVSAFATGYFREFFSRMPRKGVLVFDNYQDAGADAQLHDVLEVAVNQVAPGTQIMVLSRTAPPSALARIRANGLMTLIGWEDLQLNEAETLAILKQSSAGKRLTSDAARQLHHETGGWAAGVMLLSSSEHRSDGPVNPFSATQIMFDYFAREIFRRIDQSTREFLLCTAFLPKLSIQMAQTLSGEPRSKLILEQLTERNLFTVKYSDLNYEYHPLFRSFLIDFATATFDSEKIVALKSRSAQALVAEGEVDAGIGLLLDAQNWSEALRLILSQAHSLMRQGRVGLLQNWLHRLPESLRLNQPWVLYWQGACLLTTAPADARNCFEQAFARFEKQSEGGPLYLAWSGIVETYLLEMNDFTPLQRWIDCYPLLSVNRTQPAREVETASVFTYISALLFARTDHLDLPSYSERAEKLFEAETDPDRRLSQAACLLSYHVRVGDVPKVGRLLDMIEPYALALDAKPLAALYWHIYRAIYTTAIGNPRESLRTLNAAIALAKSSGVRVLDIQFAGFAIYAHLCIGDVAAARTVLQRMLSSSPRGKFNEAMYSYFACIVFLREGDVRRALQESARSLELFTQAGSLFGIAQAQMARACAFAKVGEAMRALNEIKSVQSIGARIRSEAVTAMCSFAEAIAHLNSGDRTHSLTALSGALDTLNKFGTVTPVWCAPEDAAQLYLLALQKNIHVEYVKKIISKAQLSPPPRCVSEHWPWPTCILTLGRLKVTHNNEPLVVSGKTQKKPLELLRAMVALGGRNVSTAKLEQMLWPHIDGEVASSTLRSTLFRLRKLIGEDAVLIQEGQLSFNPEYCWLDVWAFEKLCDDFDSDRSVAENAERVLELYRGVLLEDDDALWVLTPRDRLRSKFSRTLARLCAELEKQDALLLCVRLHERGIEIDPLAEGLYRRLIRYYVRLGRVAEAVATYKKCRATLLRELHIEPAAETNELYREVRLLADNIMSNSIPAADQFVGSH